MSQLLFASLYRPRKNSLDLAQQNDLVKAPSKCTTAQKQTFVLYPSISSGLALNSPTFQFFCMGWPFYPILCATLFFPGSARPTVNSNKNAIEYTLIECNVDCTCTQNILIVKKIRTLRFRSYTIFWLPRGTYFSRSRQSAQAKKYPLDEVALASEKVAHLFRQKNPSFLQNGQ